MEQLQGEWHGLKENMPRYYKCGFCGCTTASKMAFSTNVNATLVAIYICSGCNRPTFLEYEQQTPAPILGNSVEHLPDEIEQLYSQARRCTQVEAYTACIMVCRKILMHVAVQKGAKTKLSFFEYVEYLSSNGYVPPDGKGWVNHIRDKGNEANHEIVIMSSTDALELLSFIEMLLKFVYEFPASIMPPQGNKT